jgi:hypothetical protein
MKVIEGTVTISNGQARTARKCIEKDGTVSYMMFANAGYNFGSARVLKSVKTIATFVADEIQRDALGKEMSLEDYLNS